MATKDWKKIGKDKWKHIDKNITMYIKIEKFYNAFAGKQAKDYTIKVDGHNIMSFSHKAKALSYAKLYRSIY